MDGAMHDALADGDPEVARILESSPRGVSLVIGPTGDVISDIQADSEGILYAEINLADCVEPRQELEMVGNFPGPVGGVKGNDEATEVILAMERRNGPPLRSTV